MGPSIEASRPKPSWAIGGLDERILAMNRRAAARLGIEQPYAEVFAIERWREGHRAADWRTASPQASP
jgi:hypothetical protein